MSQFPENTYAEIPDDLQELVDAELLENETIRWMDMPIPPLFSSVTIEPFLFGIFWTAGSLFWMCGASGVLDGMFNPNTEFEWNPGRMMFAAFGIPFVLIGLWMLATPWRVRRSMKRTVYVITDQRALIIWDGSNVTSYYPADFSHLRRTQKPSGTGDICFQTKLPDESLSEDRFQNIRNVREVERLLQELKGTK